MDPRKTSTAADKKLPDGPVDGPVLEKQDWEAIESGAIRPDSIPDNGDLRYDEDAAEGSLEEEDDNPYQNSDEALPDDEEEAALARNPGKEGGFFDEI